MLRSVLDLNLRRTATTIDDVAARLVEVASAFEATDEQVAQEHQAQRQRMLPEVR